MKIELPDDFAEKIIQAGSREGKTLNEMLAKILNEWLGRQGKHASIAPKGYGVRPEEKRRP